MISSAKTPENERKLYKLLSLWYKNNIDGQLAPETCRMYGSSIKHIKTYCKDINVSDIDEEVFQAALNEMCRRGYAKSTIDKVRIVMKRAVEYAVRIKWLKTLPLIVLHTPKKAPTVVIDALSKNDQKRVEDLCSDSNKTKYGHITLFLINTGLRSAELYNLEWRDFVDGERPYIKIRKSKTENGIRKVPLNSEALRIIKAQPVIQPYIFRTATGCKLSSVQILAAISSILARTPATTFLI